MIYYDVVVRTVITIVVWKALKLKDCVLLLALALEKKCITSYVFFFGRRSCGGRSSYRPEYVGSVVWLVHMSLSPPTSPRLRPTLSAPIHGA